MTDEKWTEKFKGVGLTPGSRLEQQATAKLEAEAKVLNQTQEERFWGKTEHPRPKSQS